MRLERLKCFRSAVPDNSLKWFPSTWANLSLTASFNSLLNLESV